MKLLILTFILVSLFNLLVPIFSVNDFLLTSWFVTSVFNFLYFLFVLFKNRDKKKLIVFLTAVFICCHLYSIYGILIVVFGILGSFAP